MQSRKKNRKFNTLRSLSTFLQILLQDQEEVETHMFKNYICFQVKCI